MARYEDLKVWQPTDGLAHQISRLAKQFPRDEQFETASQIRRAALSVPTNLVEGSGLKGSKGFLRHVRIAIASLREVEYLLRFFQVEGYVPDDRYDELNAKIRHARILLHRLAGALERSSV